MKAMKEVNNRRPRVYLSGSISGLDSWEVDVRFAEAALDVALVLCEAVSPLDNGLDDGARWEEHMLKDLAMLSKCDAMYIMDERDIQKSVGVQVELLFATRMGLSVLVGSKELAAWAKSERVKVLHRLHE